MATSNNQLSRFAAIFAGGTLASRLLGLVRDMVVLPLIPKGPRVAFLFAFKLPNMFRDMLGEGAVNAAFVPLFSEKLETGSREAFRELVGACLSAMLLVFGMLTVLGVAAMPLLPHALALVNQVTGMPTRDPAEVAELVLLLQWTFPYLFLMGLGVFAMGPLFAVHRYAETSWSPILLNLSLILTCLTLRDAFDNPAWALVAGVWLGGIAQLVWMMAAMRRHAGVLWPNMRLRHPGVRRVFWLLGPVILGQAAGEVNKLVDAFFALDIAAVDVLFVANRLVQFPLSIFGVAVAVAVLPALSRAAARQETQEMRSLLLQGLLQSGFLLLPATVMLVVLGEPVIRLLFERGEFGEVTTRQSAQALQLYALGLVAFAWVKVSAQAFYARQNTRTPVIAATCSMLLNIGLNIALVGPFGFQGLAFATSVSFTVNALLLLVLLDRSLGTLFHAREYGAFARMGIAAAIAGLGAHLLDRAVVEWLGTASLSARALDVVVPLSTATLLYPGMCKVLGVSELDQFMDILRRRSSKA